MSKRQAKRNVPPGKQADPEELRRMEAADPVLSEPPQYRDPTWPGVYIEASGSIPVQWRAGTDGKWRADYAALAECALDMAADRRESPARRKAARELAGLLKQYMAFGTPRKKEGWFVAWGPEARKHLDKMDRVGSRMQALAVRLGFASASQPVYVPSASVRGRVLQERLTRQTGIVKAWAATRPAEGGKGDSKEQPWDDDAPEYIPLTEAVKLTGGLISVQRLSRRLTPTGEMRYMRKGQRCKVHLGDFRRYMKGHQSDPEWAKAYLSYLSAAGKGNVRFFWRCESCGHEQPEGDADTCPECRADKWTIVKREPPKPKR